MLKWLQRRKKTLSLMLTMSAGLLVFHFFPLPLHFNNKPQAQLLLAENGELLAARIAADQQWRLKLNRALPEKYLKALLLFEDRYFYQHPGINPAALLRAAWSNHRAEKIVSGGSTLSMQTARLLRNDPPRTYTNKLIEMFYALKLEWHYSKNDILGMYADNAPFGGNTVGINAASWRYFRRNLNGQQANDLTWAEAALLAVLPNSPALIHPGRGRDKLKVKRDRLLLKLHHMGHITETDYQLAVLENLPAKAQPFPQLADHLLTTLIKQRKEITADTHFHSTLDYKLQRGLHRLSQFASKNLHQAGIHNLAILVIDNQSFKTRAYIGNQSQAETFHDYGGAVDIIQSPRSTGSLLKPFLYGLMLDSGAILPHTLIPDIPSSYQGFSPENYDHQYRGAVPAHKALAQSLNIPAVRMLKDYGIAPFHQDLQALGMSTLFREADDYGLSLILGGAEGTLWDLTAMNARLIQSAREGWKNDSNTIQLLQADASTTGRQSEKKNYQTLSQGAAWLTLQALLNVSRPELEKRWRDYSSSQHIAWKTGTSYGLRDAWAIGSNGRYTVGVWAGSASGEGVAGLSGLQSAAPILFQSFHLLGDAAWISKPEFALKQVNACKDNGYLANDYCETSQVDIPLQAHFQTPTPHHKQVLLGPEGKFRVHGACEQAHRIKKENFLVLPPLQEYYWKQSHREHRSLPPWREDCIAELANFSEDQPIELVYPYRDSKIFIPRDLDGEAGKTIFKASHRNSQATIHWHINNHYVTSTQLFHEIALNLDPGKYKLTLIDNAGIHLKQSFIILKPEES